MATHDYVIDNGTGSAVRADLNLLFKAILTNNSGTTDPSTVISSDAGSKAFSFWADTNSSPAVLKIRNAADDGWIELFQLDGTITLEDGSVSAPALANRGDLDTGVFFSADNTFNVATGGVERMELGTTTVFNEDGADVDFRIEGDTEANLFYVDAGNNHIGINDSTPSVTLDITGEGGGNGEVHVKRTSGASCFIQAQSATAVFGSNSNHAVSLKSNSTTALTIDTSQRVGIGTTSPSNMLHLSGTDPIIQFTDTAGGDSFGLFASHTNYLGFYNFTDSRVDMVIDGSGRVLVGHTTSTPMDNDANNPIFAVEGAGNGARIAIRSTDATAGNGAFIYLTRTRGTSAGSKTTVQSGDSLGGLIFMGADGTHDTRGAIIQAEVDGAVGDNDMPARLVFMTTPDGGLNSSERMRITSAGLVGINTDSPSQTLEVNGNISLGNGGSSGGSEMLRIFNDSGVERIHATNNPSGLAFGIGGTASGNEAFRIDTGEKVLIGITSPPSTGTSGTESAKLQVGISGTSGTAVGFMDTGGFDTNIMVMNHARAGANSGAFSGVMIQFRNSSNTSVGGISSGASTTTYSTSSDYRLKENEVLISDGITRLKQLKPYRFNFKITPNITQDGFFAHEAQAVVPQAVTGTKDGMRPETYYEEGDDLPSGKVVGSVKTYSSTEIDIQQLDYSQLVPLLTAALQESISKIEVLETKVAALEAA